MEMIKDNMTAVETLLDWLGKNHYYIGNDLLEKVEELKKIEKQQIIDAFNKGFITDQWDKSKENKAEQYYNETYKLK
jgi:hypothetical protein